MNTPSYKKLAIDWLTGKYQRFKLEDEVWFDDFDSNNNRLQTLMNNLYFPFGYTIEGVVQGKTSNNDGIEYSVLYGNYANEEQTTNMGFIMILDNEYNPIQIFKQYSNGEYLGNILSLNVGNDGRFYLVEVDNQDYMRFVLLNNILAKSPSQEEYQLVQRQTYRFPDQNYFYEQNFLMYKHPQNAKYLMVQVQSSGLNIITKAIEFTINVGSSNEWKYYSQTKTVSGTTYWLEQNDLIASWNDSDQLMFKSVYTHSIGKHVYYDAISKSYDSDTLTDQSFDLGDILYSYDMLYYTQGIIKNFDVGYMTIYYDDNSAYTAADIYKIDFTNNTKTRIFSEVINVDNCGIRLAKTNEDIFFYYSNYYSEPNEYRNYAGIIVDETIYKSIMGDTQITANDTLYLVSVQKQFNLYTMYVQIGNNVFTGKLLYIDKNNNRLFVNFTTMNPYYIVLYDENDKKIFARTLYNKNINGATTTSIVQVPNQFLNDITIAKQHLGGRTYYILTTNDEPFTKNQYEEVYVNFANTWRMINQNDNNNPIINIAGASRFNQAISQATAVPGEPDYDGVYEYANSWTYYYRINYSDDTYLDKYFREEDITIEDLQAPFTRRYFMNLVAPTDKTITSIQILSLDKQTIYQTITDLNLQAGKYYEITQDVYVV